MQEMKAGSLGQADPLEKETATHTSILAEEIPWTEEPGADTVVGSQRVSHHLVTELAHTEATVNGETSHISLHLLSDKRQHTNISAGVIFLFFLDKNLPYSYHSW